MLASERMLARAAYVLVGGRSSRFGQDKARFEVGGLPMALRVARAAAEAADAVTLVGPRERYADFELPIIDDETPAAGPLSGLVAALGHTSARWTLVAACDLPGLDSAFLELLFRTAESGRVSAVIPVQRDGRVQPLCAVYSKSLHAPLRENLRRGVSKLTTALGGLDIRYLNAPEYAHLEYGRDLLRNVNAPADLALR